MERSLKDQKSRRKLIWKLRWLDSRWCLLSARAELDASCLRGRLRPRNWTCVGRPLVHDPHRFDLNLI